SPNSIKVAQEYYANLKGRMEKFGRSPDDLKVLPGLSPVVASTMSEAEEKFDEMQAMIDPVVAKEILATVLGYVDLSEYDLDDPVPELPETNASKSTVDELTTMAREENLTIRELAMRVAGARGKLVMTGTPSHIADFMEDWLSNNATDGFNILPSVLPASLNDFVDMVIPELQKRDLFRTKYEGRTLRENLGLKRPQSRNVS
ncbi:MAG: LLM class flavin-dependent oxidoreductase, partial [Rhodospirillaceae bacterium]|nr:LLM class flavin-dependent oxidoreductase [Rhodospirillaceae bacterium]